MTAPGYAQAWPALLGEILVREVGLTTAALERALGKPREEGGLLGEISEESFTRLIEVNVTGTWLCMRAELAHMRQNGGDFAAGKFQNGSINSAFIETCTLCHGPGKSADVKVMHKVGEFRFN